MNDRRADSHSRNLIRVTSLVQAETVTGPMKPLLMFAKHIQIPRQGRAQISQSAVTTFRAWRKSEILQNVFLQAAAAAGLPVAVVPERFFLDPAILPKIARNLIAGNPHVIETHDFKSHFLVWLIKQTGSLAGRQWLAFHHGYTKMSARVQLYQQLDRLSLPAADQVVTVCKPFVQQLTNRGVDPRRICILANAVERRERLDPSDIQGLKHRLGLRPEERVILSVGRLSAEKGHSVLLAALRSLLRRLPGSELRLVLVGDGGEAEALRAAAADLGNKVLFAGHLDDPWPYFCLADVFVLPSYSEGSPLVLFEAMSAGLPIVASSVGGIPEVLTDGESALLIRAGCVEGVADAVEKLLRYSTYSARIGRAAAEVAAKYSPENYTENRISIYESLLSRES